MTLIGSIENFNIALPSGWDFDGNVSASNSSPLNGARSLLLATTTAQTRVYRFGTSDVTGAGAGEGNGNQRVRTRFRIQASATTENQVCITLRVRDNAGVRSGYMIKMRSIPGFSGYRHIVISKFTNPAGSTDFSAPTSDDTLVDYDTGAAAAGFDDGDSGDCFLEGEIIGSAIFAFLQRNSDGKWLNMAQGWVSMRTPCAYTTDTTYGVGTPAYAGLLLVGAAGKTIQADDFSLEALPAPATRTAGDAWVNVFTGNDATGVVGVSGRRTPFRTIDAARRAMAKNGPGKIHLSRGAHDPITTSYIIGTNVPNEYGNGTTGVSWHLQEDWTGIQIIGNKAATILADGTGADATTGTVVKGTAGFWHQDLVIKRLTWDVGETVCDALYGGVFNEGLFGCHAPYNMQPNPYQGPNSGSRSYTDHAPKTGCIFTDINVVLKPEVGAHCFLNENANGSVVKCLRLYGGFAGYVDKSINSVIDDISSYGSYAPGVASYAIIFKANVYAQCGNNTATNLRGLPWVRTARATIPAGSLWFDNGDTTGGNPPAMGSISVDKVTITSPQSGIAIQFRKGVNALGPLSVTNYSTNAATPVADTTGQTSPTFTSGTGADAAGAQIVPPVLTFGAIGASGLTFSITTDIPTAGTGGISVLVGGVARVVTVTRQSTTALTGTLASAALVGQTVTGAYNAADAADSGGGIITSTADATNEADDFTARAITNNSTQTEAPISTITAVSIAPTTATLYPGGGKRFVPTVTGTEDFDDSVTWSKVVSGDPITLYPLPDGSVIVLVNVGAAAGNYQIRATSVQDNTKLATATITVQALPSGGGTRPTWEPGQVEFSFTLVESCRRMDADGDQPMLIKVTPTLTDGTVLPCTDFDPEISVSGQYDANNWQAATWAPAARASLPITGDAPNALERGSYVVSIRLKSADGTILRSDRMGIIDVT